MNDSEHTGWINQAITRLFDAPWGRADWVAMGGIAVVMICFSLPLLYKPFNITKTEIDWLQLWSLREIVYKSVVEDFQIPLHTHLVGGGFPYVGHPENMAFSPLFALILIFGVVLGQKLVFVFTFLAGALGMYLLLRLSLRFSLVGSAYGALILGLNSYMPYHIHTGNMGVTNYYFMPYVLLLFRRSAVSLRAPVAAGVLMAFLLANAIGIPFINIWFYLVLYALLHAVGKSGADFLRTTVSSLGLILAFTAGLGAFRIFPVAELLGLNPRSFNRYEDAAVGSVHPINFYRSLCTRGPYKKPDNGVLPGGDWADSVMYIGILPVCLSLLLGVAKWRETWRYWVLVAVFSFLCMGQYSPVQLFYLLWHLPLFRSIHVPTKYFAFFVVFTLALILPYAFTVRGRALRVAAMLFGVATLADIYASNRVYLEDLFPDLPPKIVPSGEFYQLQTFVSIERTGWGPWMRFHRYEPEQFFWMQQGLGKINWYCGNEIAERARPRYFVHESTGRRIKNPAYRGEVYFEKSARNRVLHWHITANRITARVSVREPDALIINQNADPHWRTNVGVVDGIYPLLRIRLSQTGQHEVRIVYRPLMFYFGVALSLCSWVVACLWWRAGTLVRRGVSG